MNIELPLDGASRDRLQPVSRAVFQSKYAFEAVLLIAQEERFYPGQIADVCGCQPNYARDFMRRLEAATLIVPLPKEPGQSRHYYRRLESPLWEFCVSWAKQILPPA
jgi:hypothetical protein